MSKLSSSVYSKNIQLSISLYNIFAIMSIKYKTKYANEGSWQSGGLSEPLQNRGSRVRVLPPLPITEVERLRFSFFLCFSVQKRFSIYFFNRFLNQHESTIVPFRTLCDTISVQYSIKKVSRASKEHQGDRRFSFSAVAFFFVFSDTIFESL